MPVAQAADEQDHAAHHPGADQSQAALAQDDKAAGMKMMRGMSGGMMGKKKKGEPVTEDGEAMGGMQTGMMAHHKMMEVRMDMMQMMMEPMMEHETTEQKMERGG